MVEETRAPRTHRRAGEQRRPVRSLEMRAFTEIPLEEWNRDGGQRRVDVPHLRAVVPVMREQAAARS
jgi:hypothetical protein